MNYIKHTIAAHERLRQQPDARPQHLALYWALFFAWNAEYFDAAGLPMDHPALMQAARIGNERTYRATLYDLDAWGLIAYRPSKARGTTTTCRLTQFVRAEVPEQKDACTGRSAPTKEAFVQAEVPEALRAEVPPQTGFVRAEVREHSLLYQTSFQTVDTNSAAAAESKKKKGEKTAGEGLSSVEVIDDTATPNGAGLAGAAPKKKVAPKKKGVQAEAIRAAATAQANEPRRRGRGRAPRPELPFTESPINTPALFAAAFEGTDYALADLSYYFQRVSNWRDKKTGEPPHRTDWIATARTFMLNDARDNCLKLAPGTTHHEPGTSSSTTEPGGPTTGYRSRRWD